MHDRCDIISGVTHARENSLYMQEERGLVSEPTSPRYSCILLSFMVHLDLLKMQGRITSFAENYKVVSAIENILDDFRRSEKQLHVYQNKRKLSVILTRHVSMCIRF